MTCGGPTSINQLWSHNHTHHINYAMPVLVSCYRAWILQFIIISCVLALLDKPHAFSYRVKGHECMLLMVNQRVSTGRQCDSVLLISLLSDVKVLQKLQAETPFPLFPVLTLLESVYVSTALWCNRTAVTAGETAIYSLTCTNNITVSPWIHWTVK